jgi:hypothetical protein
MAWCRDLLDYCEIAWFVYMFNLVIHIYIGPGLLMKKEEMYWVQLVLGRDIREIFEKSHFEILPCECCVSRHGNRKIWIRILSCNRSSQSQTGHIRLKFLRTDISLVEYTRVKLFYQLIDSRNKFGSPTQAKIAQHCPIKCCNNANNDAVKYHSVHYLIIHSTT